MLYLTDFMHTSMIWIFNIYVIIYNIKKIVMFRNEYTSHVNDCICNMFYFSICVLVQDAFQNSFHSFLPCDNWIKTSKIAIAFEKLNFSPNLKSQNKAMHHRSISLTLQKFRNNFCNFNDCFHWNLNVNKGVGNWPHPHWGSTHNFEFL